MNKARLDKWLLTYEAQLKQAVIDKPQAYTYGLDEVPGVVAKMAAAFERDSYNKDGEAIKRTCKALGIPYTRTGINAYLNALEPHEEAHVDAVMKVPMSLTKGRDGWEALSWVHIPGRLENDDRHDDQNETTHVRVHTGKASRGGIYTSASEVTKTAFGFKSIIDFHDPLPWEHLGESPDKCTEKSVAILHRVCLSRLKELRPELFPQALREDGTCPSCERDYAGHVAVDGDKTCTADDCPAQEAPMPDALGLATDPDEWTEFAPSGKEPCATGVDEDDTRFLRPVPGGGVHLRVFVPGTGYRRPASAPIVTGNDDDSFPAPNAPKPYTVVLELDDPDSTEPPSIHFMLGLMAENADEAGRLAIKDHIETRGLDDAEDPDYYRVQYKCIAIYAGHLTNLVQ